MLRLVENNLRRKQLAWLEAVLLHKNWNMSDLSRAAGVNASTISKFRSDADNVQQLSTRVVEKIANASGIPPYDTAAPAKPRGFAEVEAESYQAMPGDPLALSIGAARGNRNGIDAWVLRSRALETAGYLDGDVLMVDLNAEPRSGDVVCAQIYDDKGGAKTVFRILEDPYIIAASSDPAVMRPWHVGRDPVVLRGVVIQSFRPRRAA
jgi:transcriptional regulator with XRE-family HTH domain